MEILIMHKDYTLTDVINAITNGEGGDIARLDGGATILPSHMYNFTSEDMPHSMLCLGKNYSIVNTRWGYLLMTSKDIGSIPLMWKTKWEAMGINV